jgi:hypothetical protein
VPALRFFGRAATTDRPPGCDTELLSTTRRGGAAFDHAAATAAPFEIIIENYSAVH